MFGGKTFGKIVNIVTPKIYGKKQVKMMFFLKNPIKNQRKNWCNYLNKNIYLTCKIM
jgi:hypothetical protein